MATADTGCARVSSAAACVFETAEPVEAAPPAGTAAASATVGATGSPDAAACSCAAWASAPVVRSGTSLMKIVTRKPSRAIGATYRKMSAMPWP